MSTPLSFCCKPCLLTLASVGWCSTLMGSVPCAHTVLAPAGKVVDCAQIPSDVSRSCVRPKEEVMWCPVSDSAPPLFLPCQQGNCMLCRRLPFSRMCCKLPGCRLACSWYKGSLPSCRMSCLPALRRCWTRHLFSTTSSRLNVILDDLQDELRAHSVLAPAGDSALFLTPRNGQGLACDDSAEGIASAEGVEGHIMRTIALICGPSKPRRPAEAVSWMLCG